MNAACDAIGFTSADISPVQIVPHEIVGYQQIVIDENEVAYPAASQHDRDLAAERAATNQRYFAGLQCLMVVVQPTSFRLRRYDRNSVTRLLSLSRE